MDYGFDKAPEQITRSEGRQSLLLWIGLLTGPGAWTAMLLVNYSLEEVISCTEAARVPGEVLGIGIEPIIFVVTTVLAGLTLLAGVAAFRCYRSTTAETAVGMTSTSTAGRQATDERARWMAAAGVMLSVLFFVIILVNLAPPFLLEVCDPSL